MSLESIQNVVRSAVAGLQWPTAFEVGRAQALNIFGESRDEPLAWMLPPSSAAVAIGESNRLSFTYTCEVFFFKKDETSSKEQASNQILLDCHQRAVNCAIKLLSVGQDISNDYDQFSVSNFNFVPIHKFSSKILTGVSLTFQITAPDDFDFCNPC